MDHNLEAVNLIHEDSSLAIIKLDEVISELEDKDNKIKEKLEDMRSGYEEYYFTSKEEIEKLGKEPKEKSMISRFKSESIVRKDVKEDNSDTRIADMFIKGITLTELDIDKIFRKYDEDMNEHIRIMLKEFLRFTKKNIKDLRKYL